MAAEARVRCYAGFFGLFMSKPRLAQRLSSAPLHFNISEVARMLNVSTSTLRLWERLGLTAPLRSPSGYRLFTRLEVERLKEIQQLKNEKRVSSAAVLHLLKGKAKPIPVPAPSAGAARSISRQLRGLRLQHRMTLTEAADQAGISVSFLSCVERGQANASVATLQKLASVYNTNVLSFFGEPAPARKLVRRSDRRLLDTEPGITIELLALGKAAMEPHLFRVAPGSTSGGSYSHEGEEFIYMMRGQFEIWLDEVEHYVLGPGDSLYFSSHQTHRWKNAGRAEAVLLWINTPPTF